MRQLEAFLIVLLVVVAALVAPVVAVVVPAREHAPAEMAADVYRGCEVVSTGVLEAGHDDHRIVVLKCPTL